MYKRQTARGWAEVLDIHFRDTGGGAYFFTADDAEALIIRTKSAADNATPAGNSVMAATLARLYYLTGEESYRIRSEEIFKTFAGDVSKNFFPHTGLLCANELLQRCVQIIIVGAPSGEDTKALLEAAWRAPNMNKLIYQIAPGDTFPDGHPAAGKEQSNDRATAYVCIGQTCSLPLTAPANLRAAL